MFSLSTPLGKMIFEPRDPSRVTMYVCGPTVYDAPHIGNARSAVVFDILYRRLRHDYPSVVFAKNITDIDDKIIARAAETGQSIDELTQTTAALYNDNMASIGVLPPTDQPFATDYIDEMVEMIERLLQEGIAYEADGHVFFSVEANRAVTSLVGEVDRQAGARVAISQIKRDPRDFVLWKPSPNGEPAYTGPLGLMGRPGWHIECSAMIDAVLGEGIDIHGGGGDLIFPHHQCEIMQSESLTGKPLARYWVHNGMLTVDGSKMSKSAGNFITVPDVLNRVPGEVLRYLLLSAHYRQSLDFTWDKLTEAHTALNRLYRALESVWSAEVIEPHGVSDVLMNGLNDDLNTPEAIAALHGIADQAFTGEDRPQLRAELLAAGKLLGLLAMSPDAWFGRQQDDAIEALIERRENLRWSRDYAGADAVRAELTAMGVTIEDTPKGPVWRTT